MNNIHFIGIGGSGINAAAALAVKNSFQVTGCDQEVETAYSDKVRKLISDIHIGHDPKHLENIDLVVVSPSVLLNSNNEELKAANEKGLPILTWQEFVGKYLLENKKVICIAGTHGKSTTTALASLVFEKAGLDPSCLVGATVKEWGANFRAGNGEVFIIEADEFYNNFLHYNPETIVLNNIEFDHPDFFKSEDEVFESFEKFLATLKGEKKLIVNVDSMGVMKLLGLAPLPNIPVTTNNVDVSLEEERTVFKTNDGEFTLKIPGKHNVSNALGVIALAKLYGIDMQIVREVFLEFDGVGRRLELIGEKNGIKVYDDYAHHPTAIRATIQALRQKYKNNKIWVVVEAHGFARTNALLDEYNGVFDDADRVLVGPIFKARDINDFGVSGQSIVDVSNHKQAVYLGEVDEVISILKTETRSGDIILVMGAGNSYKWARRVLGDL